MAENDHFPQDLLNLLRTYNLIHVVCGKKPEQDQFKAVKGTK